MLSPTELLTASERVGTMLVVTNVRRGFALLLFAALLYGIAYASSESDLPGGAWANRLALAIGVLALGCALTGLLRVIYGLWRWNAPAEADG